MTKFVASLVLLSAISAHAATAIKPVRFIRFQCSAQLPDKSVATYQVDEIGYDIDNKGIYYDVNESKLLMAAFNFEIDGKMMFKYDDSKKDRRLRPNVGIVSGVNRYFDCTRQGIYDPTCSGYNSDFLLSLNQANFDIQNSNAETDGQFSAEMPMLSRPDVRVWKLSFDAKTFKSTQPTFHTEAHCVVEKNIVGSRADIEEQLGDSYLLGVNLDQRD